MKNRPTISRMLAFVIMLLLSMSMLPQKTVHEWLGCHKDRTEQTQRTEDQLQLSKQSLHCSCDQPEFQSPFLISSLLYTTAFKVFISIVDENIKETAHCTTLQSVTLRGPPAANYRF